MIKETQDSAMKSVIRGLRNNIGTCLTFEKKINFQDAINNAVDLDRELKHINQLKTTYTDTPKEVKVRQATVREEEGSSGNSAKMDKIACHRCHKLGYFARDCKEEADGTTTDNTSNCNDCHRYGRTNRTCYNKFNYWLNRGRCNNFYRYQRGNRGRFYSGRSRGRFPRHNNYGSQDCDGQSKITHKPTLTPFQTTKVLIREAR